jgi:hypothetical protein
MKWLDIGQEARGVFAFGQFATGVFAFGQVAYGFVAVGQVAFGAIAIGQLAVGGVTVGMASFGLFWAGGMVGVGGRGMGFVLPLLPTLGPPRRPPQVEPYGELKAAQREGWVMIDIEPRDNGRVAIYEGDDRLRDLRLDARVVRAARDAAPATVHAHIRRSVSGPVVDEFQHLELSRLAQPRWWFVWAAQLAGLLVLAAVVWLVVAEPLLEAWFGPEGVLTADEQR